MFIWVIYDVKKNKTRNRIIKQCKKAGLYRVQKSVFFGNIEINELKGLKIMFKYIIDTEEDSIYILPMSKKHLDEARFIGLSFDKELVCGEKQVTFF